MLLYNQSPYTPSNSLYAPPSLNHILGTDYEGHDLFSQLVWGSIPSLFVGIAGALGSVILGLVVGVLSGYYGKLGIGLGFATDTVMAFPTIPLLILVASLFLPTDVLLIFLLALVMWPVVARAIRAQVSAVKKLPYVDAARVSGMRDRAIITNVIIPEVGAIAIAYFIINVALAIILTTALEFLGVGNPTVVSWGSILYWAQQYAFFTHSWWWVVAPGFLISLVSTGFALVGFSIEEVLNPRLRT
jgi:peptide/nickel transport system permease protein